MTDEPGFDASLIAVNVITLFVEDEQRSKEFYERVFGTVGIDEGHGTIIFRLENLFLRLLQRDEGEREMLGRVAVGDPRRGTTVQMALRTEDADAFCAQLEEQGVSIAFGPVDRPWGMRNAAFLDPDGHVWQFGSEISG
jgi:catechol 2,3-dioxygenase-like lactoylglutathione lyase family enzyme